MAKISPNVQGTSHKGTSLVVLLATVLIAAASWMGYRVFVSWKADSTQIDMVQQASFQISQLPSLSQRIKEGDASVASSLRLAQEKVDTVLSSLASGKGTGYRVHESARPALDESQLIWSKIYKHLQTILGSRSELRDYSATTDSADTLIHELRALNEKISIAMVRSGASGAQIYYSGKQNQLLSDLQSQPIFNIAQTTDESSDSTLDSLLNAYSRTLNALMNGQGETRSGRISEPSIRALLSKDSELFQELTAEIRSLQNKRPQAIKAFIAADAIGPLAERFNNQLHTLKNTISSAITKRNINPQMAIVVGAGGIFLFVIYVMLTIRSGSERAKDAVGAKELVEQNNRRFQEEMSKLMDEIRPLSNGDLTSQASMDGKSTSQVATVFNKALSSLRDMVSRLKQTAMEIASASEQSRRTSENLQMVNSRRDELLSSTSGLAKKMDSSINAISEHATATARSAHDSEKAVSSGRESVEATHKAVEVADSSIQASSEGVKKLGEDIQQIDSIILTIREITDNLQSLSYNTQLIADRSQGQEKESISATADKMDNLARTVNGSLADIGEIVKAISGRAVETQGRIEKSRQDVVTVVRNSRVTLESFGKVANAISHSHELVRHIDSEVEQLTATSQRFVSNISDIESLGHEQTAAQKDTVAAISRLTDLAAGLNDASERFHISAKSYQYD